MPIVIDEDISVEPALEAKALSVPDRADKLQVIDQTSYEEACLFLRDTVAVMRKEIIDHHAEAKAMANKAHKAICDAERRVLKPIKRAERLLKQRISAYDAERRRRQLEADRLAREERERALAEELETAIEEAESAGASVDEVRAIINEPVAMPRPVVAPTIQRVSGIVTRGTYKCEVTDLRALCRAVADGQAPLNLVMPNSVALHQMARAQGPEMMRFVKGVRVYQEHSVATRRK